VEARGRTLRDVFHEEPIPKKIVTRLAVMVVVFARVTQEMEMRLWHCGVCGDCVMIQCEGIGHVKLAELGRVDGAAIPSRLALATEMAGNEVAEDGGKGRAEIIYRVEMMAARQAVGMMAMVGITKLV